MSSFKVFLPNNEIRRFRLIDSINYDSLEQYLCTILAVNSQSFRSMYNITYIDDEQEQISLSNTEELLDAISLANGNHVKLYLRKTRDEEQSTAPPLYHTSQELYSSSSTSLNSSFSGNLSQQQDADLPPPPFNASPFTFQTSFQNFTPEQLPPQLAFLQDYLNFGQQQQQQQQQQQINEEHVQRQQQTRALLISDIQDMIFTMIIVSARMSSYLVGGRVSLNEQRVREQYDIFFQQGLNSLVGVSRRLVLALRRGNNRLTLRKLFKFVLALYLFKILLIPLASTFLCILAYIVGIFWTITWTLFPALVLIPLAAVLFRCLFTF